MTGVAVSDKSGPAAATVASRSVDADGVRTAAAVARRTAFVYICSQQQYAEILTVVHTAPVDCLDLRVGVGGHPALSLHSSNEPRVNSRNDFGQNDSTITLSWLLLLFFTTVLNFQGMKKIRLCNTEKYKNQDGMNRIYSSIIIIIIIIITLSDSGLGPVLPLGGSV